MLGSGASLVSHRHMVYNWSRMPSLYVSLNGWSMSVCRLPGWLVRRRVFASLLYTFLVVPQSLGPLSTESLGPLLFSIGEGLQ